MELTVLMPCLNEAATVASCITKALDWLARRQVRGEVLVADNGSADGSIAVAEAAGARVVKIDRRGYGAAILGGVRAAHGRYVVVGDADDTYDFGALDAFLDRLRAGDQLVVGNRFRGGIEPGAMPWLHRYVGTPALSAIGRRFFGVRLGDFNCGLRGFDRRSVLDLGLRTSGMEFASELIVRAALAGYRIAEVPTTLAVGRPGRPPHLRTWADGWRHLRFLLLYSPRWLFQIPGLVAFAVGLALVGVLTFTDVRLGPVRLSTGTLIYAASLTVLGWQSLVFGIFVREYATTRGLLPRPPSRGRLHTWFELERGIAAGAALAALGLAIAVASVLRWGHVGFADLDPVTQVRIVAPSSLCLILGLSVILSSFVWWFLHVDALDRQPTA